MDTAPAPARVFLSLTLLAASTGAGAASEPKNILFYGNSYTQWNDENGSGGDSGVPDLVTFIAEADGHARPNAVSAAVGGVSLIYHANNNTDIISTALPAGETWDTVVMQGQSLEATRFASRESFLNGARLLAEAVAGHSPGVDAVLYQTWARGPGSVWYSDQRFEDPAQFQGDLEEGYGAARDVVADVEGVASAEVARVGAGFAELGWDLNLYASDLSHPSARGTLLASMILYGTIYADDLADIDVDFAGDSDLATRLGVLGLTQDDWNELAGVADTIVPAPMSLAPMLGVGLLAVRRRR